MRINNAVLILLFLHSNPLGSFSKFLITTSSGKLSFVFGLLGVWCPVAYPLSLFLRSLPFLRKWVRILNFLFILNFKLRPKSHRLLCSCSWWELKSSRFSKDSRFGFIYYWICQTYLSDIEIIHFKLSYLRSVKAASVTTAVQFGACTCKLVQI